MKTSPSGRALIEAFEGLYLKAYYDEVGVLTIGYGHTNLANVPPRVTPGMVITREQADSILADDLAAVEKDVERIIHVPLTQGQFDALVSFHFNTGALGKGTVDDKINRGDNNAAMETLIRYHNAGGRILNGLVRRREAERLMYDGHTDEALKLSGWINSKPYKAPIVKKKPVVLTKLQSFLDWISR